MACVFPPRPLSALKWCVCLPVLQSRPDDGLIELGDLSLQHRPQAFSQAVVVLLQFLLVLLLVWCDQVLILLDCLATPTGRERKTNGLEPVIQYLVAAWGEKRDFSGLQKYSALSNASNILQLLNINMVPFPFQSSKLVYVLDCKNEASLQMTHKASSTVAAEVNLQLTKD